MTSSMTLILSILFFQQVNAENIDNTSTFMLLLNGDNVAEEGPCTDGGPQLVGNWQRCPGGRRSLSAAIAYCANLEINGSGGFHLPSKDELKSLVLCTNGHPTPLDDYVHCSDDGYGYDFERPTISDGFVCGESGYWTSTYFGTGGSTDFYWYVEFSSGASGYHSSDTTFYVRCKR